MVGEAAAEHGGLDRLIVNAGLGKGGRIGTGRFAANLETAQTNVLGALVQCEAAMEHFYDRKAGHLVLISSMSAMRGMPSSMTTYAATKAAVAHLAEGIRMDLIGRKGLDIKVTTLYPGYIASEMNEGVDSPKDSAPLRPGRYPQEARLMVDTETGSRALVGKIEAEVAEACVPTLPWAPLAPVMKHAPLGLVKRLV